VINDRKNQREKYGKDIQRACGNGESMFMNGDGAREMKIKSSASSNGLEQDYGLGNMGGSIREPSTGANGKRHIKRVRK